MKILFKLNSNPLHQDSLIGAIEYLKQHHQVALFDDSNSFFEIYDKFNPDITVIDSNNINKTEEKFHNNKKVPVIDWNEISKNNVFINKSLFYITESSKIYDTYQLAYIKYFNEKDFLIPYLDVRNTLPTKIFCKDFIRSHVYCGFIPYTHLNAAMNSTKRFIATNTLMYHTASYLGCTVVRTNQILGTNEQLSNSYNPEDSFNIITNAPEYKFAS